MAVLGGRYRVLREMMGSDLRGHCGRRVPGEWESWGEDFRRSWGPSGGARGVLGALRSLEPRGMHALDAASAPLAGQRSSPWGMRRVVIYVPRGCVALPETDISRTAQGALRL